MATIKLGVDSRPATKGAKEYRDSLGRYVKQPSREAAGSVKDLDRSMVGFGATASKIKGILGPLFAGFTATAAVLGAANMFRGFESGIAEVSTLVNTAEVDMAKLTQGVLDLGRSSGDSFDSLTKGLYDSISAGIAAEDALSFLGVASKLGIGGKTSTAVAVDGLTSVLNAYGLSAESATDVSDAFFVAMKAGKTTVGELAANIGKIAPIASLAKVGFEEVLAAMAAMTKAGITTDQSTTALVATLQSLINPSTKAQQAAKELGIEWDANALRTKGLLGVLQQLNRDGVNPTIEQQSALATSVEAFKAVATLAANDAKNFTEILGNMGVKAGETDIAAAKMSETLDRKVLRAINNVKARSNELFSGVSDIAGSMVNLFTEIFNVATGVDGALESASTAAQILGLSIRAAGYSVAAFVAIKAGIYMIGFAASVLKVGSAFKALSVIIAANPIGAIALAIGIAIALFDKFKDRTVKIGEETVTVGDIVGGTWDYIAERFVFAGKAIAQVWETVTGFIGDSWETVTNFLKASIESVTLLFGVDWETATTAVLGIIKFFANSAIALFLTVIDTIGIMLTRIAGAAAAFITFNPLDPIESFKRLAKQLNPVEIIGDVGKASGERFAQDYVGAFLKALPQFKAGIGSALDAYFGKGFSADMDRLFNPLNTIDEIKKNALARARARAEAEIASGTGNKDDAELDDLKKKLANINAEIAALGSQGDIKIAIDVGDIEKIEADAKSARFEINQLFADLEFEATLVGKSNEERRRAIELRRFEILAIEAQGAAIELAKQKFSQFYDASASLAGITNTEAAKAIAMREFESRLITQQTANVEALKAKFLELYDAAQVSGGGLARNFEELGESLKNALEAPFSRESLEKLAKDMSETFTNAIGEVIDGTKSLKDAFEDVIRGIQQAFVENFLLKPVQGLLDNVFSSVLQSSLGGIKFGLADGDVVSNGRREYFADGEIFGSQQTFDLRGGGLGKLGERGPEAVLPLGRDSQNRLGVRFTGSGGEDAGPRSDNRRFEFKMSFPSVKNPDDFRPARRQLVRDFKKATDGQ